MMHPPIQCTKLHVTLIHEGWCSTVHVQGLDTTGSKGGTITRRNRTSIRFKPDNDATLYAIPMDLAQPAVRKATALVRCPIGSHVKSFFAP